MVDAYLVVTRLISLPDVNKTSRDVFETYKKKQKEEGFSPFVVMISSFSGDVWLFFWRRSEMTLQLHEKVPV